MVVDEWTRECLSIDVARQLGSDDVLERAGIAAPIADIVDAHGAGRRRVTFHARREGPGMLVGFMVARSHDLVAVPACPVLAPGLARAPAAAQLVANRLGGSNKPVPAYAGGISLGYQPPEALVAEAEPMVEMGYRALKLRIGDTVANDIALKGSWIDQAGYQWVKAEIDVINTISWGFFILRIPPGARIEFSQMRVNDEVWLPKQVHVRADAKLGLLKTFRANVDITYRNYRKFRTESQILDVQEAGPAPK